MLCVGVHLDLCIVDVTLSPLCELSRKEPTVLSCWCNSIRCGWCMEGAVTCEGCRV